jgi:cobalt-zinc-cadmium efflux system membrane fusion protein
MTAIRVILLAACMTISLQPTAGHAHEGHDEAAPSASAMPGANVPRVEAQSDLFEIVGVVQNGLMTLFLDRYATNEPVVDAKVDIEAGPLKGTAQANPDGTYTFKHAALTQPGQLPVTFTITAGRDSDLLAGDLVIGNPSETKAHADGDSLWRRWWWAAGGLVLLAGIAIAWWSRRKRVKGIAQ